MAEGGYDPCVCACIYAMRRLMDAIKMSQNICSDTGCLDEYPGFQMESASDQYTRYLLILFLWIVIAVIMFLYRPKSLRRSPTPHQKQRDNDSNSRRDNDGSVLM